MTSSLQTFFGTALTMAFFTATIYWRVSKHNVFFVFVPAFTLFFILYTISLLSWTMFVVPKLSPVKHLPTAPQKPWYQRLLKEPNAFHFERWINEVPNVGLIRYFGAFNTERVLATSPEVIRQIMHSKAYEFEKQYSHKTHLSLLSNDSLVTVEGDVHKLQRKIMVPAFWTRRINQICYPIFWHTAGHMAKVLQGTDNVKRISETQDKLEHSSSSQTVSVDDIISRTVFDILGRTAFNHDFQCLDKPHIFHEPSQEFRNAFNPTKRTRTRMLLGLILPACIVDHLPIEFNRIVRPGLRKIQKQGLEMIQSKKRALRSNSDVAPNVEDVDLEKSPTELTDAGARGDIIGKIMETNVLDDTTLLNQVMMLHAGGTHTAIAAVKSAIWFLAQPKNRHIQQRLRQEIREQLPSPEDTNFNISRFKKTPYLIAVRDEVFRLHSAFSTTGRQPIKPTEVVGTVLPKGIPISVSPWAMHRATAWWGVDAKEFKPDRWLPESIHARPTEHGSHIAFGIGPRACIGEQFAKAEINCLLATLFGRFKLEFANNEDLPRVTHQVTVAFHEEIRVKITRIDGW